MKIDYAEVLINGQYSTNCTGGLQCLDVVPEQEAKWGQVRDTIQKWSSLVEFANFGISGEEPLLHPALDQWLQGVRELLPHSHVLLITNGHLLQERADLIKHMIRIAPSKLCVVLGEKWKDTVQNVFVVLEQSEYRFLKCNVTDPIAGIQCILIDRNRMFEVELYQHRPVQTRKPRPSNQHFYSDDIFQASARRKSMPVLSDGRLFKCGKAARLWQTYKSESWINDYMEDASVYYEDDLQQIDVFLRGLHEESRICQFCHGCIECVVNRK